MGLNGNSSLNHDSEQDSTDARFPLVSLILGIAFPAGLALTYMFLFRLEYVRYRPWIAQHVAWAGVLLQQFSLLVFFLVLCGKRKSGLLLHPRPRPKRWKEFLVAFMVFAVITLGMWLIALILKRMFNVPMPADRAYQGLKQASFSYVAIVTILSGVLLAPFFEELYVRGFLYNALKTRLPLAVAVLLQAAVFAILHFRNVVVIFFLGIALALLYEKRKTLWSPIFLHGLLNAFSLVPLAIGMLYNIHIPASNWEEAAIRPAWHHAEPDATIVRQEDAAKQRLYAIENWGSKGKRRWKQAVNALEAVCYWFPEDRQACAMARQGIATIYCDYLCDLRRAVNEAERIVSEYPRQKYVCARALAVKGWSHYRLKELQKSREAFNRIIKDFSEHKDVVLSAKQGILQLNTIEGNL
ncbi:MAG: CPBP family glutamic-type intramembrane protease [Planctomycetota bacterium]|jgi:membrane protease YdiL (CAAX protease family)